MHFASTLYGAFVFLLSYISGRSVPSGSDATRCIKAAFSVANTGTKRFKRVFFLRVLGQVAATEASLVFPVHHVSLNSKVVVQTLFAFVAQIQRDGRI